MRFPRLDASRAWLVLALTALLAPSASATPIVFANVPGGAWDGLQVGAQYQVSGGTRFAVDLDGDGDADENAFPLLERRGADVGWAFVNDPAHVTDTSAPGHESALGDWMLAMPTHDGGMALLVAYAWGMSAAGGTIWDIDGNELQGTEQWRVDALGVDGSVLESVLSPLGEDLTDEGLNARPWDFAFQSEMAEIFGLRIEFVGTKTWGIGVAFGGFAAEVPEPGTLALLAIGIAALATRRPAV